jgi:hypothetical protein
MMAVSAGVLFLVTLLFAPRYGLISRVVHQLLLGTKIVRDDILGFLYRYGELAEPDAAPVSITQVRQALSAGMAVDVSLWNLARQKLIKRVAGTVTLTPSGLDRGRQLVRSHRLWETYLCNQMGYCDADIHRYAHELEHFTDAQLQTQLDRVTGHPSLDPHQRQIPEG